jgi:hypothetical protein
LEILTLREDDVSYQKNAFMNNHEAIRSSLPVQKSKEVQNANGGQDVPIDFGHQLALGGGRERRQFVRL